MPEHVHSVHRGKRDIRIVDILLGPGFRGRGIGSRLLGELTAEARDSGRLPSVHVGMHNPARAQYERLGFRPAGEHGVYLLMELAPEVSRAHSMAAT